MDFSNRAKILLMRVNLNQANYMEKEFTLGTTVASIGVSLARVKSKAKVMWHM